MPQAMERLLATPNTMPRLPAINLAASAIDPPVPEMTALYIREATDKREATGPEGFSPCDLAFERPGAPLLATGSALDLAHERAKGERIGEMPAHSALPVAKGRNRLDHAGEPP